MPAVRQVLDQAGLAQVLSSRRGATARALFARGYAVEKVAKERCPVDTSRLRGSIHTRLVQYGGVLICEVGTDVEYAIYVHEGTGLYGPRHDVIRPKNAKVLVFTPRKGAGGGLIPRKNRVKVFARWVRGSPGRPFLREALRAVVH